MSDPARDWAYKAAKELRRWATACPHGYRIEDGCPHGCNTKVCEDAAIIRDAFGTKSNPPPVPESSGRAVRRRGASIYFNYFNPDGTPCGSLIYTAPNHGSPLPMKRALVRIITDHFSDLEPQAELREMLQWALDLMPTDSGADLIEISYGQEVRDWRAKAKAALRKGDTDEK